MYEPLVFAAIGNGATLSDLKVSLAVMGISYLNTLEAIVELIKTERIYFQGEIIHQCAL